MQDGDIVKNWYCPNCKLTHQSVNSKASEVPMHSCAKLFNATFPMVLEGVKAFSKVELREDYLGQDIASVRTDNNQVIKSVVTEYEDGSTGGTIYLPCAVMNVDNS